MIRMLLPVAALTCLISSSVTAAPKSALDGFQFDGVAADAVLKDAHQTRRQWMEATPVQAKEYWRAWDCKGKPCDSKWQANIRAKAALIPRTEKDPPPSDTSNKSVH